MLKFKYYHRNVLIDICSGIFRLLPNSATGKTFLCSILDDLRRAGHTGLYTFTYSDVLDGRSLNDFKDKEISIIVVDRFDMYASMDNYKLLKTFADKGATVLVDMKHEDCEIYWDGVSSIYLKKDEIKVKVRRAE